MNWYGSHIGSAGSGDITFDINGKTYTGKATHKGGDILNYQEDVKVGDILVADAPSSGESADHMMIVCYVEKEWTSLDRLVDGTNKWCEKMGINYGAHDATAQGNLRAYAYAAHVRKQLVDNGMISDSVKYYLPDANLAAKDGNATTSQFGTVYCDVKRMDASNFSRIWCIEARSPRSSNGVGVCVTNAIGGKNAGEINGFYQFSEDYFADLDLIKFQAEAQDNFNRNIKLKGATYSIYTDASCSSAAGDGIAPAKFDDNGDGTYSAHFAWNELDGANHTYCYKETSAPSGYNLDPNVYQINLSTTVSGIKTIGIVSVGVKNLSGAAPPGALYGQIPRGSVSGLWVFPDRVYTNKSERQYIRSLAIFTTNVRHLRHLLTK